MSSDKMIARQLEHKKDIAQLKALFENGAITRREFTSRLLALGVGATLAGALLAGTRVTEAATPKRGGRLRAASGQHGPSDTLDPARFTNTTDFCRGEQFYNGLTRINGKLEAEPELAESWEAATGARDWIFRLRKGVEFHHGKPFEARDVVYSINRHLDEKVGSSAKGFVAQVEEIKAQDKHTVRIKLKGPNADFPVVLGLFQMKMLPDGYTDFGTAVGTGPFKVKVFKPGIRSVGERNPNYWDEGKPYLDEIEWFGISDPIARLSALLAGNIQMLSGLDPRAIPRVEQSSGVRAVNTPAGQYVDIVMMNDRKPGDSNDFRLAIKYLLNREGALKRFYKDYGMIGNDQPISPVDPYYCDEIPIRPFDPDRAKHHLKKAGMEGATVELHTSEAAGLGAVEQALMLRQEAGRIGLTIDVKRDPSDGYWSAIWMKKGLHVSGWNMRPTTDIMLTLAFKSDAAWNEAQWKSSRFDELLEAGRAELDKEKRKVIYCEAQRLIHDTGGVAIPCFFDYLDAMSEKVKGFEPVPLGPLAASQWPKFVWLES